MQVTFPLTNICEESTEIDSTSREREARSMAASCKSAITTLLRNQIDARINAHRRSSEYLFT